MHVDLGLYSKVPRNSGHVRSASVIVQNFCVATLPPLGDPLLASLRALVGEGGEGYPKKGASKKS